MNKKEVEICEFELHLEIFFVCALNLTNDDVFFCLKTRSENGYGFWRSGLKTGL